MSSPVVRAVLWLFVIFLGIAFGAGLYESRVVVPGWVTSPDGQPAWSAETARADDTGRRFWAFVTTGPLTLLTLASLFLAWRSSGALRSWWLGAAAIALADRIFTFAYFIPTLVGLMRLADSPATREAAMQWATLDYVRHAIVLAAWVAGMKAFALAHATSPATRTSRDT
jgi:hypothetical protein